MARLDTAVLILFTVIFASSVSSIDARKLLSGKDHNKKIPSSLKDSLVLSALTKGTVPSSTPSKKGHAMPIDEKLFSRHLAAIDRILQSVPSPGAGH